MIGCRSMKLIDDIWKVNNSYQLKDLTNFLCSQPVDVIYNYSSFNPLSRRYSSISSLMFSNGTDFRFLNYTPTINFKSDILSRNIFLYDISTLYFLNPYLGDYSVVLQKIYKVFLSRKQLGIKFNDN